MIGYTHDVCVLIYIYFLIAERSDQIIRTYLRFKNEFNIIFVEITIANYLLVRGTKTLLCSSKNVFLALNI